MPQAVHSDLFLYADDSGLTLQQKDVHTIEYEWFVDNKSNIHLGEDKTKCILFRLKLKLKNAAKLNIMYNGIEIKQYSKVTYLGCLLDETMSEESMALKTIKKIGFEQCVTSIVFRFINGDCPYYLSEFFEFAPEGNISLRNNFLKLKQPFRNTSTGQKAVSFIGPSFWNQISETLRKTNNFNQILLSITLKSISSIK